MAAGDSDDVRFMKVGRFALDLKRGMLLVDGREVALRPRSFEVLRVLVRNRGELVTRQQLFDEVWGDTIVTDDSLTHCLADIRRAIDDPGRVIVRTLPRRGYIFEGDLVPPRANAKASPSRRSALSAAGTLVVCALALFFSWQSRHPPGVQAERPDMRSIAVLPFTDMTAAQNRRYLGEGLSEEILNLLAKSDNLRVIARTSSFSVRHPGTSIKQIGELLDVTYVLDGSIREGEDELRVAVQLISTRDSSTVWSQSYQRSYGDILRIQADIAAAVAASLELELTLPPADYNTGDPHAHALVVQAHSLLNLLDEVTTRQAAGLLERALALDAENVRAHLELARATYLLRGPAGTPAHQAAMDRMNELIDKAYLLGPDDAQTNAFKGWQALHHQNNLEAAARYHERALALDPTNPDVIRPVINALVIFGNSDDATRLARYIVDRDPLCVPCYSDLSIAAMTAGNFDLAIAANQELLRFRPEYDDAWANLGRVKLRMGDAGGALEALQHYSRETPMSLMITAIAGHMLGRQDQYHDARARLIERFPGAYSSLARVEAVGGNIDAAFDFLDSVAELPPEQTGYTYRSPFYDNLRGDPRWHTYLAKRGLAPERLESINFRVKAPQ